MVAITEQAVWTDNIRQIEDDDPVQGGAGGIDNLPHEQLANRTVYLKETVESLGSGLVGEARLRRQSDLALLGETDENVTLASLLKRIKDLEAEPEVTVPVLPIGAIFDTTVDYQSGSEVAADIGYGEWERFSEGRVTVGVSTNSGDPTWTKTIGSEFGEYEHNLITNEIPKHKHSHNDAFNKFSSSAGDLEPGGEYDNQDGPGFSALGTSGYVPLPARKANFVVGNMKDTAWEAATENYVGASKPHNNTPPSVVIGRWRRTA